MFSTDLAEILKLFKEALRGSTTSEAAELDRTFNSLGTLESQRIYLTRIIDTNKQKSGPAQPKQEAAILMEKK